MAPLYDGTADTTGSWQETPRQAFVRDNFRLIVLLLILAAEVVVAWRVA